MKSFRFIVSSPNGDIYEDDIVSVSMRGIEGDLAIMANHTPFVTSVVPCVCHIQTPDGTRKDLEVERGILSVSSDAVILMSGGAKWK